ncbi:hypothetical protein Ancab_016548 [Ancistrocladus abbreviatus]
MLGSCLCGVCGPPKEHEFQAYTPASFLQSRSKSSKNPFAARGLGEFCALLAEIEEKRAKIYAQFGSEEISAIHFVFSNDNRCKPIVVKVKGRGEAEPEVLSPVRHKSGPIFGSAPVAHREDKQRQTNLDDGITKEEQKGVLNLRVLEVHKLRVQPFYYLSLILMLALFWLALFGRTGTIFCTTIGWYGVPSMTNRSIDSRRPSMKKNDNRQTRLSEKETKINLHQGLFSFKGHDAKKTSHGGRRRDLIRSVSMD